jgi:hypothetical protein
MALIRWMLALVFVASACDGEGLISGDATTGDDPRADPPIDRVSDPDVSDPCGGYRDSDGDTIADRIEGDFDFDGDTLPSKFDSDSDGDTVPDSVEAGDHDLCTDPVNSDQDHEVDGIPCGDMTPDFLDDDSDNDGLTDFEEEYLYGTDRLDADTDHDGFDDFVEVLAGSDPTGPSSVPPADILIIDLPFMGYEHVYRNVDVEVAEGPVDVGAAAVDVPYDPTEGDYDASVFFKDIMAVGGFPDAPEGFSSMDGSTFYGVEAGTRLVFMVDMYNNTVVAVERHQAFRAWIEVEASDAGVIRTIEVLIVVPTECMGWPDP